MDIIKVFGNNLRKYRTAMGCRRRRSPKNAGCTELISAPSNATAEASRLKMCRELPTRSELKPINCFWRNSYACLSN